MDTDTTDGKICRLNPIPDLLVATRIHFGEQSNKILDKKKLVRFVKCALRYASCVVIAVELHEDLIKQVSDICQELSSSLDSEIHCLRVSPWGKFIIPLNAIVRFAVTRCWRFLCIQSLEVTPDVVVVRHMVEEALKDIDRTLVVGAAFPEDHVFITGTHIINGRNVPWNTLAVWNTRKIGLTGFSLLADGMPALEKSNEIGSIDLSSAIPCGIEEVCTISVLQKLQPNMCAAILLRHPLIDTCWNTMFQDIGRMESHKKKMCSKISRAKIQLKAMGIEPGTVFHIDSS